MTSLFRNDEEIRTHVRKCAALAHLPPDAIDEDHNNNDIDYHETMNGDIFKNWTTNQLLPALTEIGGKCVLIMDNAPYHSMLVEKQP
ncbi:hypothetical protein TcasGA2_TC005291 [Tribolium castaneum]|uniref:Tc1-like transposase DDE domain-containing protein n=1 Tax=Tribolium castaneum TaxID=7070 RepID=D7EKY8_TRICA|nr:hypothetical protein TcasGA2_TC005291 [Tribolium castaneum]